VLSLDLAGERLVLLPQRAAFLPAHRTLLIADAHIGKAVSFRRLGVPVPEATTAGTLARLDAALAASGAERIVFLGDLLHSARAHAVDTLAAMRRWRQRHARLDLVLVRGNHDRHAGDPPADWGVRAADEPLRLGGLALRHHPDPEPGAYVLAGHVHPCVVLGGRAHDRLRLPCFHLGPAVGLLPAFGEFTGMHAVTRAPGDRVFVLQGERVVPLPG
jgi:DNA ligase-associated metallophosphoesterase